MVTGFSLSLEDLADRQGNNDDSSNVVLGHKEMISKGDKANYIDMNEKLCYGVKKKFVK